MKKADHNGNQKSPLSAHCQTAQVWRLNTANSRPVAACPPAGFMPRAGRLPRNRGECPGELVAQGWLERRGQAGTFISERLSPPRGTGASPDGHCATAPACFSQRRRWIFFPRGLWARVMGRRLRTQTRFDLAPAIRGGMILRRAIVDYLRLSRSIECLPEQVLVGNGAARGCCLLHLGAARSAWRGWSGSWFR